MPTQFIGHSQKTHRVGMPRPASQKRPGLSANVIGGYETSVAVGGEQALGFLMSGVTPVGERDPEGGVDEDQCP